MKTNPLISVIVPIYNVEDYLTACIQSIIDQTYSNLEIILVNDGSTDQCGKICDKLGETDHRIQVIHQSNCGLSAARNTGLKQASGNFISFIDSDDYLDTHFYEYLLQPMLTHAHIGITSCQFYKIEEGKISPWKSAYSIHQPTLHSHQDCCEKAILGKINVCVWDKLYRAELLKEIRFCEGRIVEDVLFMADLSEAVKQYQLDLYQLPERLYYYRIRPGSISRDKNPILIESIRCRREIVAKYRTINPEFCQKLEEMIHAEILSLNGMLERNPVWKQKYASTYRPMLRKITIGEIWRYDKSFRNKVIWSIIRICPTLYPYLRQIKRAIFRH